MGHAKAEGGRGMAAEMAAAAGKIHGWPTCQVWFEGLNNTITTKLTISAPSGAVLATRESTSYYPPGVGYRSDEESARYLLNRGAPEPPLGDRRNPASPR
jgi:hypothetical protein